MTSDEIRLSQATSSDWPAVRDLLRASDLPIEGAEAHLQSFLLARRGRDLVGCVGAEIRGDVALLRSLAVRPDLRDRGLGRALVERALDEARRRGLRAVHLLTTTAAGFFARLGFVEVGRASVPAALLASTQFQGVCPDSATAMALAFAARPSDGDVARLPVAVLGAGPVGLAAAAQLLERGLEFVVFEAASSVGANLLDYGHVRLFSPWRYDVDRTMARQLAATGWVEPDPEGLPLAREVVERVLRPYAALPAVASRLRLRHRVVSVGREGFDKARTAGRDRAAFVVRVEHEGAVEDVRVRAVVDSTGTWTTPNPMGANGLPAIGEAVLADRIAYRIPDVLGADRARYEGRRVLVVGAGHSAANVLLDLATLAAASPRTRLFWAIRERGPVRAFGGGAADQLPARGELGTRLKALAESGALEVVTGFRTTALARRDDAVVVTGLGPDGARREIAGIDEIVCTTGQRPDLAIAGELRLRLDPALECAEALGPLIDPNVHSCGTVRPHGHRELSHPDAGYYAIGVKSYGRAPTFLMATGFEQARSVVAALAGDAEAADRVELDLPETGVCGVPAGVAPAAHAGAIGASAAAVATSSATAGSCCGPTPARSVAEGVPGAAAGGCCGPAPARSGGTAVPVIVASPAPASAPAPACCDTARTPATEAGPVAAGPRCCG